MKKHMTRLALAGVMVFISALLPSCKQGCYDCTCQDGGSTDTYPICRENYETQSQFTETLKQFENGIYGDCVCTKE